MLKAGNGVAMSVVGQSFSGEMSCNLAAFDGSVYCLVHCAFCFDTLQGWFDFSDTNCMEGGVFTRCSLVMRHLHHQP